MAKKGTTCRQVFDLARDYLLTFERVSEKMIDDHLDEWKRGKCRTMEGIFRGMLWSVRNKQGMPNTIGDVDRLGPYLANFEPSRVVTKYGDDWKKLFLTIKERYTPPGRMVISNPKSYWVIFCKSAISAAEFLSRFPSARQFNNFVSQFYPDEYTRLALPLLLGKEVYGLGFALACDFLKENGYPKFVKPDSHIRAIFGALKLSKCRSDYELFKDVIRFSEEVQELPYRVDKLFWLAGSGNFYQLKIKTSDDQFTRYVRRHLGGRLPP